MAIKLRRYKDYPILYDDARKDDQYILKQRTFIDDSNGQLITPIYPLLEARFINPNDSRIPKTNPYKGRRATICLNDEGSKLETEVIIPYDETKLEFKQSLKQILDFDYVEGITYRGQDER